MQWREAGVEVYCPEAERMAPALPSALNPEGEGTPPAQHGRLMLR
jgi:hypothetical protein